MTGSGRAVLDRASGRYEAEARSVNHRFLKTSLRTAGPLGSLDAPLEEAVRRHVSRGHVTLFVRFTPVAAGAGESVSEVAFIATAARLADLARTTGLAPPSVGDVLRVPGVLADASDPAGGETHAAEAAEAAGAALTALVEARRREGRELGLEIERLLAAVETALSSVKAEATEAPRRTRERLEARMAELLQGTGASPDEAVMAREAAILADRADVREEITRLEAHLAHAREVLGKGGAVGRTLDFLVQEIHRETNTIGSKTNEIALSRVVVEMKSDVERLREQVQNLE